MLPASHKLSCFWVIIVLLIAWVTLPSTVVRALARNQTSGQETWRKQAPDAQPIRPLKLPGVRRVKLANGLTIITVQDYRAPIVTIDIAVPVGTVNDPIGGSGLAAATAELLSEGAGGRSSQEIANEVERLGAQISTAAQQDYTEITVTVLAENGQRLLAIAGDVLLRPDFPDDEVALYKENRNENLAYQRQDPGFVAREYFNHAIYGAHPYAVLLPTADSISSISRSRIQGFYKSHYSPEGAVVALVGDFEPAAMEATARSIFEGWKAPAQTASSFPPVSQINSQHIYLIDRPGSEQADIRIGNLAAPRSAKDFLPLIIANTVLGGGVSSRLFLNVREQKGYAYDVSSGVDALREHGVFYGVTETRNEVVAPAIREMLGEFRRLRNEKISPEDLEHAKNYVNGSFALALSTQGGLAARLVYSSIYALGPDFLETFRERVNAVTIDQVQQAAQRYILPEQAAVVVVGDAATLKKQLEGLGPVQTIEPPAGASGDKDR